MKRIYCPICKKEVRMPTERRPANNFIVRKGIAMHKKCWLTHPEEVKTKFMLDDIHTRTKDMLDTARRCTCSGSHEFKCANIVKPYRLKRGEVRVYVPGDSAEYVLQTVPMTAQPLYGGYGALEVVDIEDDQPAVDEHKPADNTASIVDINTILHFLVVALASSIAITSHEGRYIFASMVIIFITLLLWFDYADKNLR